MIIIMATGQVGGGEEGDRAPEVGSRLRGPLTASEQPCS